jgi:hypothetical protein
MKKSKGTYKSRYLPRYPFLLTCTLSVVYSYEFETATMILYPGKVPVRLWI